VCAGHAIPHPSHQLYQINSAAGIDKERMRNSEDNHESLKHAKTENSTQSVFTTMIDMADLSRILIGQARKGVSMPTKKQTYFPSILSNIWSVCSWANLKNISSNLKKSIDSKLGNTVKDQARSIRALWALLFSKNTATNIVWLLTLVTGIAFGFGPMNTFLTVAHEYAGPSGAFLKWAVIIPSCFFQTILWWSAYYTPANNTLSELFKEEPGTAQDKIVQEAIQSLDNTMKWTSLNEEDKNFYRELLRHKLYEHLKNSLSCFGFDNGRYNLDYCSYTGYLYKQPNIINILTKSKEDADRFLQLSNQEMFDHQLNYLLTQVRGLPESKELLESLGNTKKDLQNIASGAEKKDTHSQMKDQSQLLNLSDDNLVKLTLLEACRKATETKSKETTKHTTLKSKVIHFTLEKVRWWLPTISNFLNYATINPFGVFFAFYTAILTMTFPGVNLATLVLPASAMPILVGMLAIGYAAGFVCAFFLTSQSFKKLIEQNINQLQKMLSPADKHEHVESEQMINTHLTLRKQLHSDPVWKWLTNRPTMGILLAFGCALSICIMNYYSGIQAAMLLANISILLTPGALTSANRLMNATGLQKAFGVYSALVTVFMTSALLVSVATEAKPKRQAEASRSEPNANTFWTLAVIWSTAGQLFCNYVNTVKPHGILSALRLIKAPCERVFQALFGFFSVGGNIIVCKLQAEAAEDIIDKGFIPSDKYMKETLGLHQNPYAHESKANSNSMWETFRGMFSSTEGKSKSA